MTKGWASKGTDFWDPYPLYHEGDDEIPEGIEKVVQFYNHQVDSVVTGEWSCVIRWETLELRFQKEDSGEWILDEIVGPAQIHVEQMSDNDYWMGLYVPSGARICVDFRTPRAKIRLGGWTE